MSWHLRATTGRVIPNADPFSGGPNHSHAPATTPNATPEPGTVPKHSDAAERHTHESTQPLRRGSSFRSLTSMLLNPDAQSSSINVLRMSVLEMQQRTQYHYVLHPLSSWKTLWDLLSAVIVIFYSWMIPFMLCFDWYTPPKEIKIFLTVLDAWGFLDIALRFRTGIIEYGAVTMAPKRIRHAYVHSFWFFIDLASTFPFEYILRDPSDTGTRKTIKMIKYVKLPRLLRLGRLFKYVRKYRRYSSLAIALNSLLFLSHVAACLWVALLAPCNGDELLTEPRCQPGEEIKMYWIAFHHGIVSLMGISATHIESADQILSGAYHKVSGAVGSNIYMWGSVVSVVGAVVTASLFGTIIDLVQSWNRAENAFRKKMDQITHEMDALSLPKHLRARVTAYYDYLWLNNRTFSEELNLLKDAGMSLALRQQIAIYLFKDYLLKIPFFQLATDAVLGMICMQLHQVIYMPDDFVIREGDIGRELFMIVKGIVRVMPPNKTVAHNQPPPEAKPILLGEGDFFGEIAVVMEVERTRSVKAQCVSELCILSRDGFDKILVEFPEFAAAMKRLIVKRVSEMWQNTDGTETIEKMTLLADAQMKKKIATYNRVNKLRGTAQVIGTLVPRLSKLVRQPVSAATLGMDEAELAVVQREAAAAAGAAIVVSSTNSMAIATALEEESEAGLEPIHEHELEHESDSSPSPRTDAAAVAVAVSSRVSHHRTRNVKQTTSEAVGSPASVAHSGETHAKDCEEIPVAAMARITAVESHIVALEQKMELHMRHVDSKVSQILQALELLVANGATVVAAPAPPAGQRTGASAIALPPIKQHRNDTHSPSPMIAATHREEPTKLDDDHKQEEQLPRLAR